jgi:hypothetical protein
MDAVVDVIGTDRLPLIVGLYNQIFRPTRDIDSFRRRYAGRPTSASGNTATK